MSKTARTLAGLFLVALAVRLFVAAATGWTATWNGPPVEDERGYAILARSLAEGTGFELPVPGADVAPRASFRGPLFPLVCAPVAASGGDIAAFRVVALLLGAACAPLLHIALRRGVLAERAVWAALAYAVWPPAAYLSVRALSEPLSQALLVAALAFARPTAGGRGVAGAGVLAGLSVLARPAALLPAAALGLACGGVRRTGAFLAAFALVLVPWVARNWEIHGRPLLTTNSGVTLVGGNCDASLEAEPKGKWAPPEVVYADAADPPDLGMWGWSRLTEGESDRRFASDAIDWVRSRPRDAARLAASKLVRLVDPDPHSAKADARAKAILGWATLVPVLLLAVIGAAARSGERAWTLLLLGTVATAVVFYGDTRMRTCADPALLAFAAVGALRLLRGRYPRD